MEKNLNVIFAILLFVGGVLVIGKALTSRRARVETSSASTCPTSQQVTLTDEVRLYIDKEFASLAPSPGQNVDAEILSQLTALERDVANLTSVYSKSKQFMSDLESLTQRMSDWRKNREARISKDRDAYALEIMNEAVAECGVKAPAPPKPPAAPPQPPTVK